MAKKVVPSNDGGGSDPGRGDDPPNVEQADAPPEYLTKKQLTKLLQISESTIDNRMKPGHGSFCPDFVKPRIIGLGKCALLRWIRSEVDDYMLSRPTKQVSSDAS